MENSSCQFYNSDYAGINLITDPPHSVAIKNSSSLNKVCYCSSDSKHRANAVAHVNAGRSAASLY